jgi:hypothetical protein
MIFTLYQCFYQVNFLFKYFLIFNKKFMVKCVYDEKC